VFVVGLQLGEDGSWVTHGRIAAVGCNPGRAFLDGPDTLAELAENALGSVFRTAVTRTRHWLVGFGAPEWPDILTVEALAELAEGFSDHLR
jgi:hypothetical protein